MWSELKEEQYWYLIGESVILGDELATGRYFDIKGKGHRYISVFCIADILSGDFLVVLVATLLPTFGL